MLDVLQAGKSYNHMLDFLLNALAGSKAARLQWL